MKYKLLFLTPFASRNTNGKTFRNLLALVVVVVLGVNRAAGQGTETFESSNLTASYATGNFIGDNSIQWSYVGSRDQSTYGINNKGIMFDGSTSAKITSGSISGGIGSFTCNLKKAFTGSGNRQVELFINGVSKGVSIAWDNTTVQTFSVSNINISGNIIIEIKNKLTKQVVIDDISWTAYSTPEINIKQSTTSYATASTYAFGNQVSGTSSSATTFTIENTGGATLTLSGSPKIAISGNTSEFTVDQTSTASTVAASATTSFTVTFNPTSTGAKSAAISIANDDATGSENPYVINLTGTGTVNSSSASDIITQSGYSYTSNIDYASKQTASSLTTANSVGVNGITLRDGGATTDTDALGTTLTDVTFSTGGSTAIRTAALFDGSNKIAEVAVNGATSIVFTGLSLSATDGGTKDFELRVTYQSSVTDNQQIIYTISSATASATNSGFAVANAGAAASSATGDNNRIEVTASALAFVAQPTNTLVSASMTNVTVSANDALANRDLDFTSSVRITSTGTLTGTPVDVTASSGLATFNSLTHTVLGSSLTLNAERTSGLDWDVTSNTFNITVQAPGLLLTDDDFNYTVSSDIITVGALTGWGILSAAATKVTTTSLNNGLIMTNYQSTNSSGI